MQQTSKLEDIYEVQVDEFIEKRCVYFAYGTWDMNRGSAFVDSSWDYKLGRKLKGYWEVNQIKVGLCGGVTLTA